MNCRCLLFLMVAAACAEPPTTTTTPPVIASVQITPGTDTLVSFGATRQFTAVARDASGNPVTGVTFSWSSSAPAILSIASGTGLATAVANGSAQVTAMAGSVSGSAPVTVAQEVSTVAVTPGTVTVTAVGVPQQFTAAAKDAGGSTIAGTKFLWVSSNQAVATVDTNGVATGKTSGQATITAAARGIPGNAVLTITQLAHHLTFTVAPATVAAGEPFSTALEIEIRDAANAVVTTSRAPVTLTLGVNPGNDTLRGAVTVNASNGIATFSNVWLTKAAAGYVIAANAPDVGAGASPAFAVGPAAPVALAFVSTADRMAGQGLGVQVAVRDRFGNTVTTAIDQIRLMIRTGPGPLFGDTLVNAVSGIATFSTANIQLVGTYSLKAGTASRDTATSATFVVGPGLAHHVSFTESTYNWVVMQPINPPVARILDAYDNLVDTSTRTVNIEIGYAPWLSATGPGTGLFGPVTANAVAGLATFTGLGVDRPGTLLLDGLSPGLLTGHAGTVSYVPPGYVRSFSAGNAHTCVATGTTFNAPIGAFCWGSDAQDQLGAPSGTPPLDSAPIQITGHPVYQQIAAGGDHTCALNPTGDASCWGSDADGQLGDGGGAANASAPSPVAGGLKFRMLDGGINHTCGLALDSLAWCWGRGAEGQLGNAGNAVAYEPVAVAGARKYLNISAGHTHSCAVAADSTAWCWGSDAFGQLGDGGSPVNSNVPVAVTGLAGTVVVSAGVLHTCAMAEPSVDAVSVSPWCWGSNSAGQLGNSGVGATQQAPVLVTNGTPRAKSALTSWVQQLEAGSDFTCAVLFSGGIPLRCWGSNAWGQLGSGDAPTTHNTPTAVVVPSNNGAVFTHVTAGSLHACAFAPFGGPGHMGIFCWGRGNQGQLGVGSHTLDIDVAVPTRIGQPF